MGTFCPLPEFYIHVKYVLELCLFFRLLSHSARSRSFFTAKVRGSVWVWYRESLRLHIC
jgi:hypothetical protein